MDLKLPIIIILITLFFIFGVIAFIRFLRKRAVRRGAGRLQTHFAVRHEIIIPQTQIEFSNRLPQLGDPSLQLQSFLAGLQQAQQDVATSFRPMNFRNMVPNVPNMDFSEEDKCVICFEYPADAIFAPCAHRCCCMRDATHVFNRTKTCPMCRRPLEGIISHKI